METAGPPRKKVSKRAMVIVAVVSAAIIVPIAISGAMSDSGGSDKPVTLPTAPGMQLVGHLTCDNLDTAGKRTCTGTVINNSTQTVADPGVALQWKGDANIEAGIVAIVPLLPHQQSKFTVVTTRSNPQLADYTILFTGG